MCTSERDKNTAIKNEDFWILNWMCLGSLNPHVVGFTMIQVWLQWREFRNRFIWSPVDVKSYTYP